jgi:uncharacterized membrane protein
MPDKNQSPSETVAKSRTEALSDGIFAFAMTLLVLSLAVPPIPEKDAPALLPGILSGMVGEFIIFIIAFFVIASFWLSHHRIVRRVQFVNDRVIWINILFLFFIVLIPFSTATSGDYSNVLEAVLLFHTNLLVASVLLTLMWWYIIHHYDELNPGGGEPGWKGIERAFVIPAVALLAIGISFMNTDASFWCYALIPVIMFIIHHGPSFMKRYRKTAPSPDS